MQHLNVQALSRMLAEQGPECCTVLDVREPWELAAAPFPHALSVPLGELAWRWQEIPNYRPVVCLCHHGMRSMQAAAFLEQSGLTDVVNLSGGIDAWARQIDPDCPTY